MHMDVIFPVGTTYILVIDTDAYSGNFEREIAGYCCGAFDDHGHGEEEQQTFDEETGPVGASVKSKLTTVLHEEYGYVNVTIRATPNRLNTGTPWLASSRRRMIGGHSMPPDQKGCPAYESVAIFFSEPLTAEELALVKQRAEDFKKSYTEISVRFEAFNIRDIYMVKIVVADKAEERLKIE